jgi:hypothetical protein
MRIWQYLPVGEANEANCRCEADLGSSLTPPQIPYNRDAMPLGKARRVWIFDRGVSEENLETEGRFKGGN